VPAIPRLPGHPLFGHLLAFRRDRVGLIERVYRQCGEIGEIRLFHRVVVMASPALAQAVLVDQADAFEKGVVIRKWARPVLGNGILSCRNAEHRPRRRLVQPALASKHLAGFVGPMASATEEMVDGWFARSQAPRAIDLAAEMMHLVLRIVGRALFAVDLQSEAPHLSSALAEVNRHMANRIGGPLRISSRAFRRATATLDRAIEQMIEERRRAGPERAGGDFLSSLVFARDEEDRERKLDAAQIRDEAMTLFVAGHETTATALAWMLFLLLGHPDALERVRAEADEVLGRGQVRWEDLPRLVYTRAVFNEALRLFPPVHSLGRQAFRDVAIDGYRIPSGRLVIVSTYLLHRRPDLFPDPLRFMPERFLGAEPPPFSYLPFGHGTRICVGNHFAAAIAQVVLATLIRRVRLGPFGEPAVHGDMHITLKPREVLAEVSPSVAYQPALRAAI